MFAGTILFHIFQIFVDLITFSVIRKKNTFRAMVLPILIWGVVSMIISAIVGENGFGRMRLGIYAIFIHGPLMCFLVFVSFLKRSNKISLLFLACGLITGVVGIYSFFIEPYRLQETEYSFQVPDLKTKMTIAVVADLQTDRFGDYERNALNLVIKRKPDIILLTGDYLQPNSEKDGAELHNGFNIHLRSIRFSAPLGVFAVQGDTEGATWQDLFAGVSIKTFTQTQSFRIGNIDFTALSRKDSRNVDLQIGRPSGYHIVFGHSPNYARGKIDADLLIAGHTHGGQIKLPFIGPLYVHSKIPLLWGSGKTILDSNKTLIVSNGIGMERGYAPRLRFLCRPEIVYIQLIPA